MKHLLFFLYIIRCRTYEALSLPSANLPFSFETANDNSIFRVAIELKKLIPHQYPTKHKAFAKRS